MCACLGVHVCTYIQFDTYQINIAVWLVCWYNPPIWACMHPYTAQHTQCAAHIQLQRNVGIHHGMSHMQTNAISSTVNQHNSPLYSTYICIHRLHVYIHNFTSIAADASPQRIDIQPGSLGEALIQTHWHYGSFVTQQIVHVIALDTISNAVEQLNTVLHTYKRLYWDAILFVATRHPCKLMPLASIQPKQQSVGSDQRNQSGCIYTVQLHLLWLHYTKGHRHTALIILSWQAHKTQR